MLGTQAPSREELIRRARDLAPLLASHAPWTEENRRLHDEVVEALAGAGVLKMRVPARYGGYESDASTVLKVITELARGDGATAWNVAVWSISNWLAGMFPDGVQDEVFATPDLKVCGVLSPTAQAVPQNGGMVVNGQWRFISGALHSQWQVIVAMGPAPDGSQWPIIAIVPLSDLDIIDDWHTSGLRGTGSVTTVAQNVLVPQNRILPLIAVLQGQHASIQNAESPVYRSPMVPTGCTSFTGTAVGLAKGALDGFLERLPDRKITYTDYAKQSEAAITHLQVGDAALTIEEAECHADRLADLVDAKGGSGAEWTLPDRVRARALLGRVFGLARQAVDTLNTASGGSSIYHSVPIQRIWRDVQALNLHALMHPNTNLELYGRLLCGQPPNSHYL